MRRIRRRRTIGTRNRSSACGRRDERKGYRPLFLGLRCPRRARMTTICRRTVCQIDGPQAAILCAGASRTVSGLRGTRPPRTPLRALRKSRNCTNAKRGHNNDGHHSNIVHASPLCCGNEFLPEPRGYVHKRAVRVISLSQRRASLRTTAAPILLGWNFCFRAHTRRQISPVLTASPAKAIRAR
jgi:hypothetical protein